MNKMIRFSALVPSRDVGDDVVALTASIKTDGLVNPLVVRPLGEDRFGIVEGNDRYHVIRSLVQKDELVWDGRTFQSASKLFESVNCIVRDKG